MVDELTSTLLTGAWQTHTDSRFFPAHEKSDEEAARAQEFLRILSDQISPHLQSRDGRKPNYEDIFAAALQILWDETSEIVNPLVAPSAQRLREATENLHRHQRPHIDNNRFASLTERSIALVQWNVYYALQHAKEPVNMNAISGVAKSVDELDIFSLNHDLLIERELRRNGIEFADGFGESWGTDAIRFSWSWHNSRIRLYKLHGSLDWYFFRSKKYDQFARVPRDPDHCKDEEGRPLQLLDPQPRFLTGTTVKEQSYGYGLTGEIFSEFRHRLSKHRTLICCGYGWLDKGINIRLNQWLRDARENRLVILHNGSIEEVRNKPFWLFKWDDYYAAGRVQVVARWLSQCSVDDLRPFFDEVHG